MHQARRFLCLVALLVLGACGEAPPVDPLLEEEAPMRIGPYLANRFYIDVDRFMPATDPQLLAPDEAKHLRDDDEIFGIVIEHEGATAARAYAVTQLSYYHVVNEVVAGLPVAVTY